MAEEKTKDKKEVVKAAKDKEAIREKAKSEEHLTKSSKPLTPGECTDKKCPFHGTLSVRGRTFEGEVKKIVQNKAVIEWGRIMYHPKYERYSKRKSRIHARIPQCMLQKVKVGSVVKAGECRPLSKMIHSVVLEVIK